MLILVNTLLFPLFLLNMNGSSGFISEGLLAFVLFWIIIAHVLGIVAFAARINWLRYVCAVIYLPVFVIPYVFAMLHFSMAILFIPTILFYIFIIIRKRKVVQLEENQGVLEEGN